MQTAVHAHPSCPHDLDRNKNNCIFTKIKVTTFTENKIN
jgi:hypothetical protein